MEINITSVRLAAARIKRYHTGMIIGEQSVGEHTYGVVQILRHVMNDNLHIDWLKAALDHDIMEYFTGDVPHPAKVLFPFLDEAVDTAEGDIAYKLGLCNNELPLRGKVILKVCDLLEMGFYGLHQAELGNVYGLAVMEQVFLAITKLNEKHSDIIPERAKALWVELEQYFVTQKYSRNTRPHLRPLQDGRDHQ